jgi:phosphatidylglycerophosphatase C
VTGSAQTADIVPLPSARQQVAAFDFDGTLVPGDSLRPFLTLILGRRHLAQSLLRSAPAMAVGYYRGGRDASKAALLKRAFSGRDAAAVETVGVRFAHELVARIRPDLAARLRWHRGQGHRLVLVSASLTSYLTPFGVEAGFDEVIATRLEVGQDGRLSGRLAGPNVRGKEKALRLQALFGHQPTELWAYGDSAGDTEMLAMADHPTLVRATPLPTL